MTIVQALRAEQGLGQITIPQETIDAIKEEGTRAANIGLFLLAPFLGLFYAMALPFVGLGMLAIIGGKALAKTQALPMILAKMKSIALFITAPFIGLVYAVALPFLGLGMMAWVGGKALFGTPHKD